MVDTRLTVRGALGFRRGALPLLAALLLATACSDSSGPVTVAAPAYDPTTLTGGRLYRWPTDKTVRVFVDPVAVPAGLDLRALTEAGLAAWAGRADGQLRWAITNDLSVADAVIHTAAAPRRVTGALCSFPPPVASGITFICPSPDADSALTLPLVAGATSRVKVDISLDAAAVPDGAAFTSLLRHELGHLFGIGGHSPTTTDLMFSSPTAPTPTDRDAVTLRYVLSRIPNLRL